MPIEIVRRAVSRTRLAQVAEAQFGDMVKAVVDVERRVMAIGGKLQSDEEALLIEDGSSPCWRGERRRSLGGRALDS